MFIQTHEFERESLEVNPMNKTLLKTTHNKNYNKNYNFKKDSSLHLKSSREPASTTLLGKLFQ